MASIHHEVTVAVDVEAAWAAAAAGRASPRLFAPVLVGGQLDGDTRTVTFANGMIVRERILDHRRRATAGRLHRARRRPAWPSTTPRWRCVEEGPGRCRFRLGHRLPAEGGRDALMPLIEQGSQALKANLEASPVRRSATA